MSVQAYPFLFTPVYKDYVWGGNRIPKIFNREPQHNICAESWEISDRREGMSIVSNGPLAGTSLHELVETMREKLVGFASAPGQRPYGTGEAMPLREMPSFPLLIKIIDSAQRLSVQVHPDDRSAAIHGGEPKTEMWYTLDAGSGAQVFAGLVAGTDRNSLRNAIRQEKLEEVLCALLLTRDDAIYVPGGRVHCIGKGCLLLEVQQNSNTTYRIHDWGRVERDGKPRELHIKEAFQAINREDSAPVRIEPRKLKESGPNSHWEVMTCPYFRITRLDLSQPEIINNDGGSFHTLFTVTGKVDIKADSFTQSTGPGTSCLLPAILERYTLMPTGGTARVIRISLV